MTENEQPQTPETPVPAPMDASKLLRIGTMIRELLGEARRSPLDQDGRDRLRHIFDKSLGELREVLSPELRGELDDLTVPLGGETPTESELLVAQAQVVGWLEGLFHGLQASVWAQQVATQAQQRGNLPEPRGYL